MKTYQSPGATNSLVSVLKKSIFASVIVLASSPLFSQELAIVKSPFQPAPIIVTWTESVKGTEGGAANWMNLSRNNPLASKVVTEKNMEVLEGTFRTCLDNRKGVINWSSFQDVTTNYYVIERSVAGAPFKEIAQVFTSPDSTSKFDYQYFDKLSAEIKGTIYYRLKIVDANDVPVYSPVQLASSNKTYENLLVSVKS